MGRTISKGDKAKLKLKHPSNIHTPRFEIRYLNDKRYLSVTATLKGLYFRTDLHLSTDCAFLISNPESCVFSTRIAWHISYRKL